MLLPGALGTGRSDFTPQLEGLNSMGKLTLVAWDPPGYGKSRPPNRTFPPNFFERDAQAAMKFMQSIGHDKFSILGWSGIYICLVLPFTGSKMFSNWSKFFVPNQKCIYILWQSQTFCARQKDDLHSVKLVFVPSQKFLEGH